VKRIERKPADASQSDELVAEAISIMDKCRARDLEQGRPVITQKSYVRKRRKLQEAWETGFGALRKGSDPPIDTKDARFIEHMAKIAAGLEASQVQHRDSSADPTRSEVPGEIPARPAALRREAPQGQRRPSWRAGCSDDNQTQARPAGRS
jgi:hypothetical protein